LSGLDTFNGLSDLSLASPTGFSAVGHTSYDPYQHHTAFASNHSDHEQAFLQHYQMASEASASPGESQELI
jgi:hypothetical protein